MINRRFLNYKHYESFLRDLNNGEISQDAIVFVQDESHPCIWTHGKEYLGNVSDVSVDNGTLVFGDGYGNTLFTITLDAGNLTITDSYGNQSTASYVLTSNLLRALNAAVSAKQNTLTAGDGITIDNDTISTTYKNVFLEQEAYEALESYDNNTLYFIYEESEEEPSGDAWGFDDTFPIILT